MTTQPPLPPRVGPGWIGGLPPPPPVSWTHEPAKTISVVGLVFGIVGSVLGVIPILFVLAWACGLVAFVLGVIAWRTRSKAHVRKTMAVWATLLGILAFGLGIAGYSIVNSAVNDLDKSFDCIDNAQTVEELDACN